MTGASGSKRYTLPLLALTLQLSACAQLPSWLGLGLPASGGRAGIAAKPVAAKEAPSTLVAYDGSVCYVSGSKFENADIGERILCAWRARGAAERPGR